MAVPFRILAVDDEPAVAFSLRHVFAGPRYEVLSVEDGSAALAKLDDRSEHYDAIIVDQKMPNLTGLSWSVPSESVAFPARSSFYRHSSRRNFARPFCGWT
jgi:DNA-binding NtrC family response regulator